MDIVRWAWEQEDFNSNVYFQDGYGRFLTAVAVGELKLGFRSSDGSIDRVWRTEGFTDLSSL